MLTLPEALGRLTEAVALANEAFERCTDAMWSTAEALESLAEEGVALTVDNFDHCIIGIASRCGQPDLVVYDSRLIAESLMQDGLDEDEAWEFFEFNIAGAWMGEGTPLFMDRVGP